MGYLDLQPARVAELLRGNPQLFDHRIRPLRWYAGRRALSEDLTARGSPVPSDSGLLLRGAPRQDRGEEQLYKPQRPPGGPLPVEQNREIEVPEAAREDPKLSSSVRCLVGILTTETVLFWR